jgi:hypothetical protein
MFFWLFLFCVVAAITATVLLANDKQNLRALMERLGMPLPPRHLNIPKPGRTITPFKPSPIRSVEVMIEPELMAPEVKGYTSGLLRTVFKSGDVICDTFRSAGFEMTEWAPSPLDPGTMECYFEKIIDNPEKPDEPSSFFLMVKGTKSGALTSSRLKIVISSLEGRKQVIELARRAAETYGKATGWRELIDETARIVRLEPFMINQFGTNIKFASEFGGPGRYNLIITMAPRTDAAKRTAAYFDRERFLPMLPDIANGGDNKTATQRP